MSRLPCLEKKKGYPPTIATSNGDTTTIPAVTMAEEVKENNLSYEDLFINYPRDLMNFSLEFENVCQHQQQQPDIANNNSYQNMVFYGTTLKVITCCGKIKIVLPTSLINTTIN